MGISQLVRTLTEEQRETLLPDELKTYEAFDNQEDIATFEYFYGFTVGLDAVVPVTNKEIEIYQETTDNISLKAVCKIIDFVPHAGQMPIVYSFDQRRDTFNNFTVVAGRRFGKAASLSSSISTPNGNLLLRDAKAGDVIYDIHGAEQAITQLHPIIKERFVKVTLAGGGSRNSHTQSIDVHPEHEWTVVDHHGHTRTLETQYLQEYYVRERKNPHYRSDPAMRTTTLHEETHTHEFKFKVMNHAPLQRPENRTLPITPYVMGVMLGAGSLVKKVSLGCEDYEVVDKVFGEFGGSPKHYGAYWSLNIPTNPAQDIFESLGLLGTHADTKFIPEEYFNSSAAQRMALLQGLLDTGGTVTPGKRTSRIEYTTSSERLKDGVIRLVKDLGGNINVTSRIPTYAYKGEKRKGKRSYRVYITLPAEVGNPFSISRKAVLYQPPTEPLYNYITDMTLNDSPEEGRCITVSSPDGLYVVNDNIVTHNSMLISVIALRELLVPFSGTILLAPTFSNAQIIFNETLKLVQQLNIPIKLINRGAFRFELENGARFSANSAANIESALGSKSSLLLCEESQSIPDLETILNQMLVPTLLDYGTRPSGVLYGRTFVIGTSRGIYNTLYDFFMKEEEFSNWKSFTAPSHTNPTLPTTYLEDMRKELGDMLYRQEILAEFMGQDDNVFFAFVPSVNIYEEEDVDFGDNTPYIAAIDIGWSDATAGVWLYKTADGTYYAHAAYSAPYRTTEEHVISMREIEAGLAGECEIRYIDPAAALTKQDLIVTYNYTVHNANNKVQPGIQLINQLFGPIGANETPRLFVNSKLKELIRQLTRVRYRKNVPAGSSDPFERDPKGSHWDMVAALRYAIMSDHLNVSSLNIVRSDTDNSAVRYHKGGVGSLGPVTRRGDQI